MKKASFSLGGRTCVTCLRGQPSALLIQPSDSRDLQQTDALAEQICAAWPGSFLLAAFEIRDWNRELSPWDSPPVFGKAGFGHGAAQTLSFVQNELMPELARRFDLAPEIPVILGGYSLAGIFALWSGYRTDCFSAVAAASPSVWFPGWISHAETHAPLTRAVYLSLGDREEKTKNPVLAAVGDCIRSQYDLLLAAGLPCTLEWNPGNHFRDSGIRTAAAFAWCLERIAPKEETICSET